MAPQTRAGPILRLGDRGEFVRTLQLRLESLGFHVDGINGVFGPKTFKAVKAFQSSCNLEPDGVVGTKTREKLGLDVLGHTSIVPDLSWLIDYRSGGSTASSLIQGYDANIRITQYVHPARQLAQQFLADVESGKLSHLEGRQLASSQRNELLTLTREKLTPGGRAFSEAIKDEGKTLSELIHKYSRKLLVESPDLMKQYGLKTLDPKSPLFDAALYERTIEEVGRSERISMEIIKAAGRTGKAVTLMARVSRVAGPVGAGLGLVMSAYEIKSAPPGQKLYVAGREASGFAGGIVGTVGGGLLAGWTASLACGPAAPVCAIAVSVVVVGGSAWAGGALFEAGYKEMMSPGRPAGTDKQLKPGTQLGGGAYLDEKMLIRQGLGPKL
ncbi:peptidoglycan-binding domain-containing protein [Archangium sp.]|uniref:peptidoglycan-binding domain-containing protein n=1 Tax=Archangium sp. TaxID=1872627 RepID=UPI00389A4663